MGVFRNFPYTNFHEMNLDEIIKIMREMQDEWNATKDEWSDMQTFINNYFDNLDVSNEVLEALQKMANSGELSAIIDPTIISTTEQWLTTHVTPTSPAIDNTLSIKGAGADAYETGLIRDMLDVEIRDIIPIIGVIPNVIEQGSVNTNTGAISDTVNYCRTPMIAIDGGVIFSASVTNNSNTAIYPVIIYYDKNKTYRSAVTTIHATPANSVETYSFAIPANAKYMRFRFSKAGTIAITPSEVDLHLANLFSEWYSVPANKGVINVPNTDLNTKPYINGGSWLVANLANKPDNYPSAYIGKIISFATPSDSTYGTFQIVIDNVNAVYYRFSNENNSWSNWLNIATRDNSIFNYGNVASDTDLNEIPYIHPGMWAITDANNTPAHAPIRSTGRIISFTSNSDNSIYTYQYYITSENIYRRFSTAKDEWSQWYSVFSKHTGISFKCFEHNDMFVNGDTIIYDTSDTNRVDRLMAKYDEITIPSDLTVTKTILGRDASNTFNIFNYKISNGIGTKPIVLVVFGEHGNEYNSATIGSYFYNEILNGVLKKYLKYVDFWVIPLMNPWGYDHKQRNNANDVNLNRDFPCMWKYYTQQHNKTGNYPLSQPETQYLYNLIVNNRNNILFMCNKHNTGSISNKININEIDLVGYTASVLESDSVINRGIAYEENAQVRVTDPWIISDCDVNIANKPFIVDRYGLITDGSMDLFANSIKVHGSLLEVCGSAKYSSDSPSHYTSEHYQSLARLELDYIVNYISKTIENNDSILANDKLSQNLTYKTRVEEGSDSNVNITWEQGSVNTNTGAISPNTNYCRTTEGEINGSHDLAINFTNNASVNIGLVCVYYDENHNYIKGDTKLGIAPPNENYLNYITPPTNAKYIRLRVSFNPLAPINTTQFAGSITLTKWKSVEQYWNGTQLVNIND